ncbi:MAG: hypothetical protein COV67_15140 [Nitrospinae bacterium CG11_big_fil_rev_8_21_14_0_20_56_8]|nr:MAG: hypothetical protein COV67_15140 [Nitrospinae bacterium CG11_big_fil_rev_8_21_14_0_20_56_8]
MAEFPKGGTILNIQVRDPGGNLLEGYLPSLPMKNRPLTVMAASAVKGNSGINVDGYRDYRGVRVVGAWTWLREFDFGLTMEIDVTEAHAPLIAMQKNFAALFSILVLVTGISLTMRSRHIQMARERMRMLKELKEAQVSLEQRIQERTTELRETNLRLEQEVGERMRSEQDLRNSDTRLRTILNSTLDGIITIDEQGIVEMLNPGAEKIFGYPADEVVGKPVGILMPEPYASEYYQYVRKYVDSGKRTLVGFRRELPGLRKDGSTFVLDLALNEMFLAGRRLFVGTMRDVSERKESEEWLRKLSRAVEQSSCMVMITDVQGQIEYVNPRFCEVTGFDLLEVIGKNPRFLKPAHYPPEIFKQLWETITHGREWKGEFYNVRKNGDLYWESASISPVLDKKGKVTHFLAIKEDISERKKSEELVRKANEELEGRVGERTQKLLSMNRELQNEISIRQQAEEALRESEARVRSILNNAIDGIIAINDQGNMETFNPAAERVFGFNRSEVIGKSITMLMPPDLRKLHVNGFHRYLRTGVPKLIGKGSIRLRGLKKNGEEFPLELGVSEFKVQGKSFFTGIVRDVTDREKAAADLDLALKNAQQARDWIDGILKSMAEGLIVTDSEFRVVMINSAAQNILKVSAEEVMDKSLNEIISSKDFWNQVHGFISAFTEGQPFDFELNHSASGPGTIFRVHMSLLVDRENKTSGLILAMHDVSQERRMERIKTEFISTAAHELRTPLTSIRGFSELLMTRSYDNSEKVQRFISRINSEAENLANIINDLLDISRIESEQGFLLRRSYFQLDELIETETFFFQEQYRSHRFDNHFPGKKIVCWMDKDKLEQVLKNLYSNAVKYSPHGGEIKTEIIIKENDYVVCIEDQGIGMRPDELHRMFDKFYRGEQIRSQVPGTGLGMTIVKHIIEEHGGKIWVESEVGKGTQVWFSIPITRLTPSNPNKKNEKLA